jgi:hypothetical protein
MEYLEQRYIRHFLSELSKAKELHSVVLVHDGLYVSPSFSHSEIALASEAASAASGLPALQLSLRNLTPLWQRQYGYLERQTILQQEQAKRRRRTGENRGEADASLPSQVSTGHVL